MLSVQVFLVLMIDTWNNPSTRWGALVNGRVAETLVVQSIIFKNNYFDVSHVI